MSVSRVHFHAPDEQELDSAEGTTDHAQEQQAWEHAWKQAVSAPPTAFDAPAGVAADDAAVHLRVSSAASASASSWPAPRKHLSMRASSGASDYTTMSEDEEVMALVNSAPETGPKKREPLPYLAAGWPSRLTYHWLTPFMDLGASRPLTEDDMYDLHPYDRSKLLMDGIEEASEKVQRMQEEEIAAKSAAAGGGGGAGDAGLDGGIPGSSPPRTHVDLWRTLRLQFGARSLAVQSILLVYSGMKIVQPLMLNQLVQFVSSDEATGHGYAYAIVMGLAAMGQAFCHHQYFFQSMRVGIDMRIALNTLIFKKALTLRTTHMLKTTTGQVVNLVSNDSARMEELLVYVPYLWNCPLECAIVLALLYQQIGVAAFVGFAAIVCIVPMQLYFSRLFAGYRRYTVGRTDARVKTINEILVGADVLKMMGWEESLESKVTSVRAEEFHSISAAARLKSINQAAFFASLSIVSLVTFYTMYFRGVRFTPANVFTTIAFFNLIKLPLTNFIPFAVEKSTEAKVALNRIRRFLELDEEVKRDQARFAEKMRKVGEQNQKLADAALEDPVTFAPGSIHMREASFVWELTEESSSDAVAAAAAAASASAASSIPSPSGVAAEEGATVATSKMDDGASASSASAPASASASAASVAAAAASAADHRQGLRALSLSIKPGSLVGVIGSIGSYKSSLLAALLGEMTQTNGGSLVSGSVAYASQQSWIFAASIRDNILFGREFDPRRYARTLRACQLVEDIKMQPQGDQTQIGEKGVNLSGGQRARLSCARAVYGLSDIYLLDDPLAALDGIVARKLFESVLSNESGMLSGSTRVLVTHQTHLLTGADSIVLLEHGRIKAVGTFDELVALGHLSESQRQAAASNDSAGAEEGEGAKEARKKAAKERRRVRKAAEAAATSSSASASATAAGGAESGPLLSTKSATSTNIVLAETSTAGSLSMSVFTKLFAAGGGTPLFFLILLFMCAGQACAIVADKWLANWSGATNQKDDQRAFVYLGLVLGTVLLGIIRARWFFSFVLRAASVLHGKMFHSVIYSPMRFFESNPSGRILNRFAKDQSIVDEMLPLTSFDFTQCFFMVIGAVIAVGISAPYVLFILLPIIPLFLWVRQHFLLTSRELKRLDSVTRSPVYAHFSATLSGLMIIRSFHVEAEFIRSFLEKMDNNTRCFMTFQISARWFGLRLDVIAASVVVCLSLLVVGTRGSISPSDAGFALSYCLQLTALFQWAVRQSAEVETMLTAVERIIEYGELPAEGQLINPNYRPPSDKPWPSAGLIEFKDYQMRYRAGLDLVLKGVSFTVQPGEKVGVCGRTGAGKSSLFQALLRLVERADGSIVIDGLETHQLGLKDLRGGLSIIPQYPVIFSGSVRYNLDPFEQHSEEAIWAALDAVQLKSMVRSLPEGLDSEMAEFGSNFSVGECQLMCVSRALLKPSKILLVDEATANVDTATDALIQAVIRTKFKDRTVLTIAHRLNTILDSDKIVVMAAGVVAEVGSPAELLARPPADLTANPAAHFGLFSFMANAKKKEAAH